MTNIAADTAKLADDAETEAKSGAEHVRDAFDHAKEAIKANLAGADEGEHYLALSSITAFFEHLAEDADTELGSAAAKIKGLFDEVV